MRKLIFGFLICLVLVGSLGVVGADNASVSNTSGSNISVISECEDSDGGKNYYVKGTVEGLLDGELNKRTDHCGGINSELLEEFYCDEGNIEVIHAYKCPNGCSDGACISETNETPICTDSDSGLDYYTKGLTEWRVNDGSTNKEYDYCIDNYTLSEGFCLSEPDENGKSYRRKSYDCPNGCSDGACIKGEPITEKIKCIFQHSKKEQKCYSAEWSVADEGTKFCKGVKSCVINFKGHEGEKITWKSTCGGYQYTKQDGNDEKIGFDCSGGETNIVEIQNRGFRRAYWQCYDGTDHKEKTVACKSSKEWQAEAKDFCKDHCYEDRSKCGVNSFSVSEECYLDEGPTECEKVCLYVGTKSEGWYDSCSGELIEWAICSEETSEEEIELICKNSCPLKGKCYAFGYRKAGEYCSDEGEFVEQLKSDETCDNNFECESNVCVSGECVSAGLLQRILNWFRKLFS